MDSMAGKQVGERTVSQVPDVQVLIERVIDAGSGSLSHFGYELKPDGLYLQQHPEEFAEFVHFMATNMPASDLTLDIGIASGGQTKFLRDYYLCRKTIIVDLGEHPDAVHWPRIRPMINSDLILEIFDNSHAPAVREALQPYRGQIDFVFVDGDHTYEGLWQDVMLVKELLRPGGLMALHDTVEVFECKRVYDDLLGYNAFEHVRDFNRRFGISLWRLK